MTKYLYPRTTIQVEKAIYEKYVDTIVDGKVREVTTALIEVFLESAEVRQMVGDRLVQSAIKLEPAVAQ